MAMLAQMRDINNRPREKHPLFDEPVSDHPIEVKLANMKAAILAGADVNELDHPILASHHAGRPLHWLMNPGKINLEIMKDHLPLVKLLLENGADPRLGGRPNIWPETPMDNAREVLNSDLQAEPYYEPAIPFFKEALALMEQVAHRLDAEDAANAATKESHDPEKTAHRGSFFDRFKLR